MHKGKEIPFISENSDIKTALKTLIKKPRCFDCN